MKNIDFHNNTSRRVTASERVFLSSTMHSCRVAVQDENDGVMQSSISGRPREVWTAEFHRSCFPLSDLFDTPCILYESELTSEFWAMCHCLCECYFSELSSSLSIISRLFCTHFVSHVQYWFGQRLNRRNRHVARFTGSHSNEKCRNINRKWCQRMIAHLFANYFVDVCHFGESRPLIEHSTLFFCQRQHNMKSYKLICSNGKWHSWTGEWKPFELGCWATFSKTNLDWWNYIHPM